MKINRRAFTKSLAIAAGTLSLPSWATKAEAARLPVNRVTKIRTFYPPNYNANGPQAFPQRNGCTRSEPSTSPSGISRERR